MEEKLVMAGKNKLQWLGKTIWYWLGRRGCIGQGGQVGTGWEGEPFIGCEVICYQCSSVRIKIVEPRNLSGPIWSVDSFINPAVPQSPPG